MAALSPLACWRRQWRQRAPASAGGTKGAVPLTMPRCCTSTPCRSTCCRVSRGASGGSQQPWRTRSGEPHFQPAVRATCTLLHLPRHSPPLPASLLRCLSQAPTCAAATAPPALLFARYLLEEMVPELEALEQRGYFSRQEIKAVVQKRQVRPSQHALCYGPLCFMLNCLWHCSAGDCRAPNAPHPCRTLSMRSSARRRCGRTICATSVRWRGVGGALAQP